MRQTRKIVLLALVLLIPAAIYIFLQSFGQNEFTVPIYNADGEIEAFISNENNSQDYHKVSFNDLINKELYPTDTKLFAEKIIVLDLVISGEETNKYDYQISRIADIFKDDESVHIVRIFNKDYEQTVNEEELETGPKKNISIISEGLSTLLRMAKVQLGLNLTSVETVAHNHLVLLDDEKRIRGYYNLNDFDDVDRLILEIKILLNGIHNV
jgi:hypothetical protein